MLFYFNLYVNDLNHRNFYFILQNLILSYIIWFLSKESDFFFRIGFSSIQNLILFYKIWCYSTESDFLLKNWILIFRIRVFPKHLITNYFLYQMHYAHYTSSGLMFVNIWTMNLYIGANGMCMYIYISVCSVY